MSVSETIRTLAIVGLLLCLTSLIASAIRKCNANTNINATQERQRISVQAVSAQPVSPLPVYVPPTLITPTPAAQSVSYPQHTIVAIDEAPAPAYRSCPPYTPMPISPSTPATTYPPMAQNTNTNHSAPPPTYTSSVAL